MDLQREQQPRRLERVLSYVHVYTFVHVVVYLVLYFTLDRSDIEAIMMVVDDRNRNFQAWRWYTYSLAHGNTIHVAVNVVSMAIYGFIVESLNSELCFAEKPATRSMYAAHFLSARCAAIHNWSILGGAFAIGWQSRMTGGTELALIGASGGTYGLMGSLIGYLCIHWRAVDVCEKSLIVLMVVSTIVSETIVHIFLASSNISLACHLGGGITGVLAGLAFYRSPRSDLRLTHELPVRCSALSVLVVVVGASIANLLVSTHP